MAKTSKQPNKESSKQEQEKAADVREAGEQEREPAKAAEAAGAAGAGAQGKAARDEDAEDAENAENAAPGGEEEEPGEAGDLREDFEESAQDELAAERDRYLRLAAEYDNFRKRSAKELKTTYNDARADTITKLLPVYDNLERALKMECSDEPFYKGVEMTMTQLDEILESMGVVYIEAAGEPFDPNLHNAVAAIEDPGLGEKIVAEEYQKGFMLGDRVIRFSTVVVAN